MINSVSLAFSTQFLYRFKPKLPFPYSSDGTRCNLHMIENRAVASP
jgi:hypothetical protein